MSRKNLCLARAGVASKVRLRSNLDDALPSAFLPLQCSKISALANKTKIMNYALDNVGELETFLLFISSKKQGEKPEFDCENLRFLRIFGKMSVICIIFVKWHAIAKILFIYMYISYRVRENSEI